MTLDTVQSMTLLVMALLAVAILLKILAIVHRQTARVKELEMRMKAMESTETTEMNKTTDETEKI